MQNYRYCSDYIRRYGVYREGSAPPQPHPVKLVRAPLPDNQDQFQHLHDHGVLQWLGFGGAPRREEAADSKGSQSDPQVGRQGLD